MITITFLLVLAAFLATLAHGMGRNVPLWVGVFFLCVVELLRFFPVR